MTLSSVVFVCLFFSPKIHTEFQVALPTETDKMQECDMSTNLGPPKSFVAWSEPEKLETQEKCTEQEKTVKNISEEAENQCDEGCDKETLSSTNSCDQGLVKKGAATCDIRDQPQDPPTNSPDRGPYISLQTLLREFDTGSKHFPFVDNSDNIFSGLTFFLVYGNFID